MKMKTFLPAILCTSMALSVIPAIASAEPFTIKIDDLSHGHFSNEQVYGGFGCHGQQCFVAHFMGSCSTRHEEHCRDDFSTPMRRLGGLGWTHWEIANIPPSESSLEKGASGNPKRLPAGAVETLTDFGESRYGGPCPPQGESHRYIVTASALDVAQIDVLPAASPAVVAYQMHGKVIAQAKYVARYPSRID